MTQAPVLASPPVEGAAGTADAVTSGREAWPAAPAVVDAPAAAPEPAP
jgi:hypothetical protein